MVYGIMAQKDIKLSSIVRTLKEKTTPKKLKTDPAGCSPPKALKRVCKTPLQSRGRGERCFSHCHSVRPFFAFKWLCIIFEPVETICLLGAGFLRPRPFADRRTVSRRRSESCGSPLQLRRYAKKKTQPGITYSRLRPALGMKYQEYLIFISRLCTPAVVGRPQLS